jgi:hypothetical protein
VALRQQVFREPGAGVASRACNEIATHKPPVV